MRELKPGAVRIDAEDYTGPARILSVKPVAEVIDVSQMPLDHLASGDTHVVLLSHRRDNRSRILYLLMDYRGQLRDRHGREVSVHTGPG